MFFLFFLAHLGFNHFNDLFFVGFKGVDKVNQISIASIVETITVFIFILVCGIYMVTQKTKYIRTGLQIVIYLYVCIGLLGAIDLLSSENSSIVYAKSTLVAAFTFLLYRRYVAIEDKKLFTEIFPALKNINDANAVEDLPNISEEWKPYLRNIKGHREKSVNQALVSYFSMWGLSHKSDSFQISFRLRYAPFQLKISEIVNYTLPVTSSLGKSYKKEVE
ncbi:hypothetical protein RV10_GL002375 [Enterococcus pallens]|nr:hypothetical protein RV10_GL002375 [Enterococcus pallens]